MKTKQLFDLTHTKAEDLLSKCEYPWQALPLIKDYILQLAKTLPDNYECIGENIWVEKSVKIYKTADITGPCIIGAGTEVRPGAFIRGSVLIGENCVIGNSTELKNCIIFDNVQVPHYNYVGDSVLGFKSHMGAGCITSNVKNDKTNVTVNCNGEKIETGLRKFGAMIGDYSEIGCNSVLNPGTVIERNVSVYPLSSVRGVVKANCIYKGKDNIVEKR
ncbi:MAG: UDP-N-acetylglucosamine pyrophosphorylase [Acutalibacteraceae bacterium]|nr:UDP-N-acetylglucosamine pyrophosphorylase [Acutalibacteraceae bacterium]